MYKYGYYGTLTGQLTIRLSVPVSHPEPIMPSNNIPYGRLEGIEHSELPAAIIFSVIYAPLLIVYLVLSFRKPTFVWRSLVVYCLCEC